LDDLVLLPGGDFRMGQEDGRDDERPVHQVRLSPFFLARFQVTNAEFAAFRPLGAAADPSLPVVSVSWLDAAAYCDWLSARLGKRFRLPTEAEWEFAARGGREGAPYPWGDTPVFERENYAARWREGPEPVGTSEPNAFGLFDLCENVHEWCSDWYDPGWYAVSPVENPQGPATGTRKASRGGSWRHHIKIARCAARSSIPPEFRYADYGFRIAASA
ncbi:MAG TPA: formylglycine-generating enzyme family protein, partial [Bryobacteraceae bacterium]|nr:formylglycine-generating enzyme family protein [Bryobacteraceae bacterium]